MRVCVVVKMLGPDVDTLSDISSATVDYQEKSQICGQHVTRMNGLNPLSVFALALLTFGTTLRESANSQRPSQEDVDAIKVFVPIAPSKALEKVRGYWYLQRQDGRQFRQGCWCSPAGDESYRFEVKPLGNILMEKLLNKQPKNTSSTSGGELFEDLPDNVIRLTSPITRLEAGFESQPVGGKTSDRRRTVSWFYWNLQSKKYRKKRERKLKDVKNARKKQDLRQMRTMPYLLNIAMPTTGNTPGSGRWWCQKEEPTFADYAIMPDFKFTGLDRNGLYRHC